MVPQVWCYQKVEKKALIPAVETGTCFGVWRQKGKQKRRTWRMNKRHPTRRRSKQRNSNDRVGGEQAATAFALSNFRSALTVARILNSGGLGSHGGIRCHARRSLFLPIRPAPICFLSSKLIMHVLHGSCTWKGSEFCAPVQDRWMCVCFAAERFFAG